MSTPPTDPRQTLADLIDAFAAAKQSGNETLQRIALAPLQEFINSHHVVPMNPPKPEAAEEEVKEDKE